MNILQICNDYSGSKVHENLFYELSKFGIKQTIYCPTQLNVQVTNKHTEHEGIIVIFDKIIKSYHRYMYHIKRREVFSSIQQKVNLTEVDLVHASTLFTDGGQAFLINKKYKIPYIVTVRNTDINGFLKKLPHTWNSGRSILLNAKRIIFVSQALMDKFMGHRAIRSILPIIKDRIDLIPNGIDNYYLDHISNQQHQGHRLLYVGDFSKNKNVRRLCEAIISIKEDRLFKDISLTLIGGGRDSDGIVQKIIKAHPDVFLYIGPIYSKDKLLEEYASHSVFAMPSITETFGLVYLEALTQNLPVVYTKGQGIDGLFNQSIGIGVNPKSIPDIKNAIISILSNQNDYSNKVIDFNNFRWSTIAQKYINRYKLII